MGEHRSICIVVTSHTTAATFLHGYLTELRTRGWRVTVICSPGEGIEDWAREEGVTLHTIPMERAPSPTKDLRSLVSLANVLRRLEPDVLVYATPKASLLSALAGTIAGVRTRVYELWGLRLETAAGPARHILRALEFITARLSTSVVANSRSLAKYAHNLGITPQVPAVLGAGSSHGVDSERFRPSADYPRIDGRTREFLDETTGLTVGFVGRLHPDKGVDTILKAAGSCARRGTRIRTLLIGSDEGAQVAQLCRELDGLVPVHLTGRVSDPRPYLARIDVLVLMSLREGFPNVVLEAAGMEVPAIVADSTGTVDSVVDRITGRIVPVGNAAALAEVLDELNLDREQLSRLGLSARERVVSHFDQSTVCGLHVDFFEKAQKQR
ncbi:glycosyltransferase involved in cell wall biosynthesis [Paramicrobacterium agarici]|uniref:D-inositol 3-phosphate glycosyltransferase n=1 Tax=Paramicrobacterium agarici TaxID=630514 RepID=A0A2A9DWE6_9MICO|nr:glycosyltransferase involved in cell wall biosynthesis [Microbacterium agarici]